MSEASTPTATDVRDPVVAGIAARIRAHYGDAVDRIVLFGSRARGDADAESDYDIAVFLKRFRGFAAEVETLAALAWEVERPTGAVLSLMPFAAEAYGEASLPMRAIRAEGVAL